jgi:hypothetical protein
VTVPPAAVSRLIPDGDADGDAVEGLVRETFVFLLEREPKESVLHRFEIDVVSRYFPEYEREIRRRLTR